jgi:sterol desaturase/sphingolipid hydroxylase (fatty acid hydroxylase superfamily)
MENSSDPQSSGRDPRLWEIAKRRASFKYHLGTYIVINCFLWTIWFFTGTDDGVRVAKYPWPIWPTLGWGIGLFFHFLGAYIYPKENSAEKEYEKLIRNKNK